jgi:hypothetical protein
MVINARVGDYVTITEAYSGNLVDVVGKTAKVRVRHNDLLVLELKAYKKDQDHRYWDYDVIVKDNEVEVQHYEFKDSKGTLVEVGDTVVYGPLGGGVSMGKVVEIKQGVHSRWGRDYTETKVKVETESSDYYTDGDRKVELPSKTHRWYSHGDRMLVVQKGSLSYMSNFGEITIGRI